MNNTSIKKLILAAMFIAAGMVLPFFTGQIPQIGSMMLPMHIPVLLCGLICGWRYGAAVGMALPLMRSVIFGMPPLYPVAIAMTFELATYGLVIGLLYASSRWQCIVALYRSMIVAMLAGRAVWGIAQIMLLGMGDNAFTWQMFMSGAFLNAVPGIIIQLILIPAIMITLDRTGLISFKRTGSKKAEAVVGG